MTPELWERLKPLFNAALEMPEGARPEFIARACGDDRELREELARLLDAQQSTEWVDSPAVDLHKLFAVGQPSFAEGQVVAGRFRILRKLEGGTGEVYEARDGEATDGEATDAQLGRVALRVITLDGAASEETREQVRVLRAISNPHLCRVFDLYSLDELGGGGSRYALLAMKFVDGVTLAERVRENGPLTWAEAKRIALEICAGLEALHEVGMVHGRLKSGNVMLVVREGIHHAVVMDAVSRSKNADLIADLIAPEQFEGKAVSPATDIYALGIVLYELTTGKHPFAASTPVAAAVARGRRIVKASSIRRGVPRRCDEIVRKCLEFEPKRRYQSAREAAAALCCHPLSATRLRERAARISRRKIVTAIVLLCVAVAATAVYLAYRSHRYHPPPAEARRWYEQGLAALRDGTYLQATQALQNAVRLDDDFLLAHARLAEAWAELDFTGPAQAEMLSASIPEQERNLPALDRQYIDTIRMTLTEDFSGAVQGYRHILHMLPHGQKVYGYLDLARAYEKEGNLHEAQRNYEKAAALAPDEPAALVHLGILKSRQQDAGGGEEEFRKADALYAAAKNLEGRAEIAYQRGYAANVRGDSTQARAFLELSLEIARRIPSVQLEVRTLIRLSDVEDEDGNEEKALDYAKRATQLAQENGLEYWSTDGLIHQGTAYFGNEDFADAERAFEQALRFAAQNEHPRLKADAQLGLASLRNQQGNVDAAILLAQEALAYYRAFAFMAEAAEASELIVRGEQGKGDYVRALQSGSELLALARRSGSLAAVESAEELVGGIDLSLEKYPEALAHFEAALDAGRAVHGNAGESVANQQLRCADVLWRLGRYGEAEKMWTLIPAAVSGRHDVASEMAAIEAAMRLSQRREGEALEIASAALEQFPDMPAARVARLLRVQALAAAEIAGAEKSRQRLARQEQAQQAVEKLAALAHGQADEGMIAEARLVQAAVDLEAKLPEQARPPAEEASRYFLSKGKQESQWLSLFCLALAAEAMGDGVTARQQAALALGVLFEMESAWGGAVYRLYVSRPDYRLMLRRLEELAAK